MLIISAVATKPENKFCSTNKFVYHCTTKMFVFDMKPSTPTPKPTESELEVLQILWQNHSATVRQVNDLLNETREVGYTTTLKIMQIMHEKGVLSREKSGKTHIYRAEVSQADTQKVLLDRFVERAYGGSAMKLVLQALGGHRASNSEIEEIRAYLDQIEKDQQQ